MMGHIYHITHLDNLAGIVQAERLWCDARRLALGLVNTNIGYSHIKARRLRHPVTVAAGEKLGNYVPFNFCPRSVMLYVVSQGHENYLGGQEPVVHLVSSIDAILRSGRPWFFTDRHADLGYANQIDTLDRLGEVDASVLPLKWWNEQEVKEKRQAEFLVHDWCPWEAIESIGVIDPRYAALTEAVVVGAKHRPRVEVHRDWYY